MKKIALLLIISLLPLSLSAANIATLDIKTIVRDSSAAKDVTEQLNDTTEDYQKEVFKRETELKEEEQELSKQRTVLAKDVFEQKAKDFRTKVVEFQKNVQAKRSALEKARAKAFKTIENTTVEIVKKIATKKGFDIVIPKSSLLFAKESLDISEEVLDEINDQLPEIKIDLKD